MEWLEECTLSQKEHWPMQILDWRVWPFFQDQPIDDRVTAPMIKRKVTHNKSAHVRIDVGVQ